MRGVILTLILVGATSWAMGCGLDRPLPIRQGLSELQKCVFQSQGWSLDFCEEIERTSQTLETVLEHQNLAINNPTEIRVLCGLV